MASKINADEFVDREGEGKPTLPKGVVLSGVTTITTATVAENEVANSTGINAGIITSTHFKGNLTGDVNAGIVTVSSQTVVGSAVTISASGIDIGAGVITATSYAGSGANLTGIGATIMVWEYNPDPSDMAVTYGTGIGITFNQKIKAGSGNITIREDSASGTVVENFAIGSSVTISNNSLEFTPTSDLDESQVYHLSYPSGVITNMAGESYVGTAYTFQTIVVNRELWGFGKGNSGELGQNTAIHYSSPVQIPGIDWKNVSFGNGYTYAFKSDNTLWFWGNAGYGASGLNAEVQYSSPVQLPGTTWSKISVGYHSAYGTRTDGTLWSWGYNGNGMLGQNNKVNYSSPMQIGSDTTWDRVTRYGTGTTAATKTDGTLWVWGNNSDGMLGVNQPESTKYSSPVQLPGTTWASGNKKITGWSSFTAAIRTDGTLWAWGRNRFGQLGQNQNGHPATPVRYSSPVQIPGTTWKQISSGQYSNIATKTDGTLWAWGWNYHGFLGQNEASYEPSADNWFESKSSPCQIPGTTWDTIATGQNIAWATKTDGTFWTWGSNSYGSLGHNNVVHYSSPVQIPGTDWITGQSALDRWNGGGPASVSSVVIIKES